MRKGKFPSIGLCILFLMGLVFGLPGDIDDGRAWGELLKMSEWGFQQWISGAIMLISLVSIIIYHQWGEWFGRWTTHPKTISMPNVIPIRYGTDDGSGIEGLSLKNVGEGHALDIAVDQLKLGSWTVSFIGPEVSYLEAGHTCFLLIAVEGPPTSMPLVSSHLFRVIREWQGNTEEWGREAMGCIRYKDLGGVNHETRYLIGIDVLNRDCGIVVRTITD